MKIKLTPENLEAEKLIPPLQPDNSAIGVNYADAYIKAIKPQDDSSQKVICKRKGLKIILQIGDKKGEALMRKREHGPDVKTILSQAIQSAAQSINATFLVEDGIMYLNITE